jgi:hypothetical protein
LVLKAEPHDSKVEEILTTRFAAQTNRVPVSFPREERRASH